MNRSGKTFLIGISLFTCLLVAAFFIQRYSATSRIVDEEVISPKNMAPDGVPVKLTSVSERKFVRTLNVYGKVESFQTAVVSPKIAGIVEKLHVDEGDRVEKDKTVLFEIDNLKLQQKVDNAKQNIPIVLAVEKERKALLRKSEIDFDKKSRSFSRYKSLFEKNAVTREVFDTQEADYLSSAADVDHKKPYLNLARPRHVRH